MTNKILIILALVVGTVVYYLQAVARSMCFYAGDGSNEFIVLRDRCYASYPEWKIILVSFLVGSGTFLFLKAFIYFIERMQKYFHHLKKNKI